jgi:hypothetical protein
VGLHPRFSAFSFAIRQQVNYLVTHDIDENGSVGSPSPQGEVIDPNLPDWSCLFNGQGHDTTQKGRRRGREGKPLREPCADLSTRRYPKSLKGLTQADRHASAIRSTKAGSLSVKIFREQ